MSRLLALSLTFLVASPAVAAEVTRAAAERALSGYHTVVTAERMRRLGPGWETVVEALLRDPNTRPLLRTRAIAALGFSKLPSSAALLREVLALKGGRVEGAPVLETMEAVRSLAAIDGVRALPELKRFVEHEVADVRLAAARGLADLGAPAKDTVASRVRREGDEQVRQVLVGALQRLGERP